MNKVTAFISYSRGDKHHDSRVLALTEALRRNGIDVELDQFHESTLVNWKEWCSENIAPGKADFVLCICTAEYKQRFQNSDSSDSGRGVYWEARLITQELYSLKKNTRIIPILLDKDDEEAIPPALGGVNYCQITNFDLNDSGFENLLRILTSQSAIVKPELGNIPSLPSRSISEPDSVEHNFDAEADSPRDLSGVINLLQNDVIDNDCLTCPANNITNLGNDKPSCHKDPLIKKGRMAASRDKISLILQELKYSTGFTNDELMQGRYVYPYDLPQISELLCGQEGAVNVIDFLQVNDRSFFKEHSSFQKLMFNSYYNPGDEYRPRKYFVETKALRNLDFIIESLDVESSVRSFFFIGEKGSGKTLTQNCWLHDNKNTFDDKNIFWVRCDAYKLYDLWIKYYSQESEGTLKEYISSPEGLSLERYLSVQLLYVFAKYHDDPKRLMLRKIMSKLELSGQEVNYPTGRKDPTRTEKRKTADLVRQIGQTIKKHEADQRKKFSYAFDVIMAPANDVINRRERLRWLAVSKNVEDFIIREGFHILKIVDGVDQIHLNKMGSTVLYYVMLSQLHDFSYH